MKLDYLQFLELEVFTRFGAKLEETMARKLKRGRVLREMLKQDRLHPLSIEFHLAWLIAFNEGLFDDFAPAEVANGMARLEQQVGDSGLRLEDAREVWLHRLREWLS